MSAKIGQESTRSRSLRMVRTPALALLILGTGIPLLSSPPRHLKLPTPPGEDAAEVLYNTVRDFFPTMGVN